MCALADQQSRDELVRRIGEDEVGRVKADGVPDAKLLHARLVEFTRGTMTNVLLGPKQRLLRLGAINCGTNACDWTTPTESSLLSPLSTH